MRDTYDVVVLGGGAAGLSGAIALARSRRSVLVVDGGEPRNAPADGVHNLLGGDGVPPLELVARGREELLRYGGEVVADVVVEAVPATDREVTSFAVRTAGGRSVRARRLLVATGVRDHLPDVPGLADRWGRDVLHCPYCHGWEVRDRRVVVLATGPWSAHQALLFSQLSDDVTLLLHHGPRPTDDELGLLAGRGVAVREGVAAGLDVADDVLVGVRVARDASAPDASVPDVSASDGTVPAEVVVVGTSLNPRLEGLDGLALPTAELRPDGHLLARHVVADATGRTEVPGVWAAGNVCTPMAQVVHAAGAGLTAGAQINADLVVEDARRGLLVRRP